MKKRLTKILTQFVVDVYQPVTVSDETITAMPVIKYYRDSVFFVPTHEAARYISEGSAVKGTRKMRKEFMEGIRTGLDIAVLRFVNKIRVAIAMGDDEYFAEMRRVNKWHEHLERMLKREQFTAAERKFLKNMIKKYAI